MAPEMSPTAQTPGADSPSSGMEKRTAEGRQRPYKVLRALAKIYTIFAPLLAAVFLTMLPNRFLASVVLSRVMGHSHEEIIPTSA